MSTSEPKTHERQRVRGQHVTLFAAWLTRTKGYTLLPLESDSECLRTIVDGKKVIFHRQGFDYLLGQGPGAALIVEWKAERVAGTAPKGGIQIPSRSDAARAREKEAMKREDEKEAKDVTKENAFDAVWDVKCDVCGAVPTVKATGMCGGCTFGEADTMGGDW